MSFAAYDLCPRVLAAVAALGYASPTPVQAAVIPALLCGQSLAAQARTGSGKTAAYAIPLLNALAAAEDDNGGGASGCRRPRALILVPTVELADQTAGVLAGFCAYFSQMSILNLCSARLSPLLLQHSLSQPVDIVISTPARILPPLESLAPDYLHALRFLVLDEADLLMSFGYLADLRRLLPRLLPAPRNPQTVLLSATFDAQLSGFATRLLNCPEFITVSDSAPADALASSADLQASSCSLHHHRYLDVATDKCRYFAFCVTLRFHLRPRGRVLVFASSVARAVRARLLLGIFGVPAATLDPEAPRASRAHTVTAFASAQQGVLIVPDASLERGVDLPDVAAVVNLDLPATPSAYIHRAGRTARAGRSGLVVSFVLKDQTLRALPDGACENNTTKGDRKCEREGEDEFDAALSLMIPAARDASILAMLKADGYAGETSCNDASDEPIARASQAGQYKIDMRPYELDGKLVDAFRYRLEDAMRSITKRAIRAARAKDLKNEMVNSAKLRAHFEDHRADLAVLRRHDGPAALPRGAPQLRNVPAYLLPAGAANGVSREVSIHGKVPLRSPKAAAKAGKRSQRKTAFKDEKSSGPKTKKKKSQKRQGNASGKRKRGGAGKRAPLSSSKAAKSSDPLKRIKR